MPSAPDGVLPSWCRHRVVGDRAAAAGRRRPRSRAVALPVSLVVLRRRAAITSMYRRTKLGWLWLLLRVTAPVGLNALIFGGVLGVGVRRHAVLPVLRVRHDDVGVFERSLLFVTRSLEQNRRLSRRSTFPRLILPLSAVAPGLLYLADPVARARRHRGLLPATATASGTSRCGRSCSSPPRPFC